MTNRTVDEAILLIKSCVDADHRSMSLKLSTLREMVNEIDALRRKINHYDEKYEKRLRDEFAAALSWLLS